MSYLFDPAAIDELMDVKGCSTMWTLRPLLSKPSSDAEVTAEFSAVGAEVGVLQLLHADEATEDVGERLDGRVLPPRGRDVHEGEAGDWKGHV